MPQTLDNGVIVPVNGDAYNLCPDLQTMGNAVKGITPVTNQAARDALTTFAGRTVWRIDTKQYEVYDGTSWLVQDAYEASATISTFGTGWTAITANAHTPRVWRSGQMVYLVGGVQTSATATLANVLTIPTAFQPPTTTARFVGTAVTSNASTVTFTLGSGVLQIPTGYGSIAVTTVQSVPLLCMWPMD